MFTSRLTESHKFLVSFIREIVSMCCAVSVTLPFVERSVPLQALFVIVTRLTIDIIDRRLEICGTPNT